MLTRAAAPEKSHLCAILTGSGFPVRRVKSIHKRRMSKEDSIEVTGTVVEKFPSGLFSVQLDQDRTVLAHLAGKLRRNRIRVLAGDRVTLEMSPYDLTKGRITYRHK
jgi:translation initiation factor IF-1